MITDSCDIIGSERIWTFFFLQYRESALERIIILLASNLQECREQILSFITTHHKLVALCTKLHEEIPLIDSQSFHDV